MSSSGLQVQQTPPTPSYAAAAIEVPANIATPQATMDNVKAQQGQLNAVNNLTGGRGRSRSRGRGSAHTRGKRHTVIRTYKGRRYVDSHSMTGGSTGPSDGEQIPVPQVGSPCSGGPQCAGAQNANFTAIYNQAQSNSINDAYVQSGGRRRHTQKKVRFTSRSRIGHRRSRHDQSLTSIIAYNIKKVLRKVFT